MDTRARSDRRTTRSRGAAGPGRIPVRSGASTAGPGRGSRRPVRGGRPRTGIAPTRLPARAAGRGRTEPRSRPLPGSGVVASELRLLADLLAGGLPLVVCLETLSRHAGADRRGPALAAAARAIAEGRSASEMLGATPHARALIAAGERVGRLAPAVRAAADLEDRLTAVRRRILGALAYPLLVLVVAAGVVGIVLATVVPQMAATLQDLGGSLPLITRLVIGAAEVLRSRFLLLVILAGAVAMAWRAGVRRDEVSGRVDRPRRSAGRFGRALDVAVTLRVLATLSGHGVPIVEALAGAAAAAPGRVGAALSDAASTVAAGASIVSAPGFRELLEGTDLALLAVGEERGMLAEQFDRIAERHLSMLEQRLERAGALAEPLLVLVVGAIVGTVVTALYLPTFRVFELV